MKYTTVVTDFKDLKKAIEEVTKKQPAKSRYKQQAEKMGYTKDKAVVAEQKLSEASALDGIKDIVKTKGAKKVNGVMIDMFTASVITQAYDKVNDANKKKMEKANVQTLVKLAQRVMGMKEDLDEGKYAKYSDLLIKKAKLMKAGKDASMVDKEISKELKKLGIKEEVIVEKIVGTGDAISKIFKTKDKKEIDGIANLMNMTSLKVLQSMQKQNPKGFKRMTAKMGELPAMEEVEEGAVSAAQRAAIAISKKEKAGKPGYDKEGKSLKNKKESVMDAYREMWENGYITEEVADITVDPKNRINSGQQQGYHGMEIAKQARRMGLKSAVMHKHIRIKGPKKKVNDFLRIVIGKSRYGDPTEKDMTTPQIDKMLNKGMK